jgi:hypothetical protein
MSSWAAGPIGVPPKNGHVLVSGLLGGDACQTSAVSSPGGVKSLLVLDYPNNLSGEPTGVMQHPADAIGGLAPADSASWVISSSTTTLYLDRVAQGGSAFFNGSGANVRARSVVVDGQGNAFVAVDFDVALMFLGATLTGAAHLSSVIKVSPQGQVLWSRTLKSTDPDIRIDGVALDAAGQVVVTGRFTVPPSFGSVMPQLPSGTAYSFVAAACP